MVDSTNVDFRYYKLKLHNLSDESKEMINSYIDYARYCYNWGLEYWNKNRAAGNKDPSVFSIQVAFTEFRNRPENSWLKSFDVETARAEFRHLKQGFSMYFEKINDRPHFHTKKRSKKSYSVRADRISMSGPNNRFIGVSGYGRKNRLYFDVKRNRIPIGDDIRYYNPTISFDGVYYWFSVSVGIPKVVAEPAEGDPLGVDVGIRTTATLSDGTEYKFPYKHRELVLRNRLTKLQSVCSRDIERRRRIAAHTRAKYEDIPKSKNQMKREEKVRKTWHDLSNLFDTHYHNVSKDIANKYPSFIVVESLRSRQAAKNSHNNSYPRYVALGRLIEYIKYKCERNGCEVIKADKNFKSTQLCSRCGSSHRVGQTKVYKCPVCGLVIDRDYNAALNLLDYGYTYKQQNC